MINVTELAVEVGARASCEALGIPRASYYRWTSPPSPKEPIQAVVRAPSHRALSDREQQGVLDTLHSDRFLDRSPVHVVAELLGIRIIANGLLAVVVALLLAACTSRPQSVGPGGTAWGVGAFDSNGERSLVETKKQKGFPEASGNPSIQRDPDDANL